MTYNKIALERNKNETNVRIWPSNCILHMGGDTKQDSTKTPQNIR